MPHGLDETFAVFAATVSAIEDGKVVGEEVEGFGAFDGVMPENLFLAIFDIGW